MKFQDYLPNLIERARTSGFWLALLNLALGRVIPFNRPHGFRLGEIGEDHVIITAPYKQRNLNHIKGIHACAIATAAEFSAGFLLLMNLDQQRYRLIMARIEVTYLYQAKKRIYSRSTISQATIQQDIIEPLRQQDQVTIELVSEVIDSDANGIARAVTTWQIKRWDRVRTRI